DVVFDDLLVAGEHFQFDAVRRTERNGGKRAAIDEVQRLARKLAEHAARRRNDDERALDGPGRLPGDILQGGQRREDGQYHQVEIRGRVVVAVSSEGGRSQ